MLTMELNITNETGTPYAQLDTVTNPCYHNMKADIFSITGLKDLPAGAKITVAAKAVTNLSTTPTLNRTYYIAGTVSRISVARGFDILKTGGFSDVGMAIIAIIFSMAAGATISVMFGFGGGLICVLVGGVFFMNGFIWADVFAFATFVSLLSLLGKRWQ